jgi:hypothetical protein
VRSVLAVLVAVLALERRLLVEEHEREHGGEEETRPQQGPQLPNSSAWPTTIATTARYMGSRTYRYGPTTTRRAVGIGGAGVPSARAKRTKASSSTATPPGIGTAATTATATVPSRSPDHEMRHPLISHRIRPAITPGASARNTTVANYDRTPTPSIGRG